MSILLQKKNVGGYSYMSSPNIYYRAYFYERELSLLIPYLAMSYVLTIGTFIK